MVERKVIAGAAPAAPLKLAQRAPIPETMKRLLVALPLLAALSACEQLGIDDPAKVAAAKEADGKAIGSACRHAGRAIEDCYVLNKKAEKAAVFAGWKEMNDYMRENKIEEVVPQIKVEPKAPKPAASAPADGEAEEKSAEAKPDKGGKAAGKH